MKFLFNKIYIILLVVILIQTKVFARDNKDLYSKENISNYFIGLVSVKNHDDEQAYKYLKKIKSLKNTHFFYEKEFLRTLVILEKFDKAFAFSDEIWNEKKLILEADLLLGLNSFLNKDYKTAEKYFERLNKISGYDFYFGNFIGNVLTAWSKASQGKEQESFYFLSKVSKPYHQLNKIQKVFLKCYFDSEDVQLLLEKLVGDENYNFSRYNFFLVNYLLSKHKGKEANEVIKNARKENVSNLLIEQTEVLLREDNKRKIKNFFNCKNPKDNIAEFFYVIANLYATEENYRLSNFYLKISDLLNEKFITNKALIAENYYYQGKNKLSKKIYKELKSAGETYSWHASKSIAAILLEEEDKKYSIRSLEKDFNLIPQPNFEHYYEMANFYKDNKYYNEAIKFYTLALEKINLDHFLIPKILYRRGTSYERLDDWKNAQDDLLESLKIKPEQAYVMNYLAYSWIDKGINFDKGLEMLIKANKIKEGDGYIIDSLGWAYYAKKNYVQAEKYLQEAVELLPTDPVINDHYADSLWMLNKHIEARNIWSSILKFDKAEKKLVDIINHKLIFGTENKI